MDATEGYFKQLTAAEFDEHEKIEAELNNSVRDGFSERSALAFAMTVVAVRKIEPSATIDGVFDTALMLGLDAVLRSLLDKETQPTNRSASKRKRRVIHRSGVRLET
jgi:hypothetical protein